MKNIKRDRPPKPTYRLDHMDLSEPWYDEGGEWMWIDGKFIHSGPRVGVGGWYEVRPDALVRENGDREGLTALEAMAVVKGRAGSDPTTH